MAASVEPVDDARCASSSLTARRASRSPVLSYPRVVIGVVSIVRIVGGPGTGKTTRLIDAAVAHIAGGADPESVLLLTSDRLTAATRGALTARLLNAGAAEVPVVREPLVRDSLLVLEPAPRRRAIWRPSEPRLCDRLLRLRLVVVVVVVMVVGGWASLRRHNFVKKNLRGGGV